MTETVMPPEMLVNLSVRYPGTRWVLLMFIKTFSPSMLRPLSLLFATPMVPTPQARSLRLELDSLPNFDGKGAMEPSSRLIAALPPPP